MASPDGVSDLMVGAGVGGVLSDTQHPPLRPPRLTLGGSLHPVCQASSSVGPSQSLCAPLTCPGSVT